MSHSAAFLPGKQKPFEVRDAPTPKPGPDEILIDNELIGLSPVEFKIAKLGIIPMDYPAIIGTCAAGTIVAVGESIMHLKVGDKVVGNTKMDAVGRIECGSYQQKLVTDTLLVSKVPAGVDLAIPVSVIMNLSCAVGLYSGELGLRRPSATAPPEEGKKVFVYGGSSHFGALAVRYLASAGHTVVTTSSPRNRASVEKLGASQVFDHTIDPEELKAQLKAAGPYFAVTDLISKPPTIAVSADVLAAQGGGTLYAVQPAFEPETLAKGVERLFKGWTTPMTEDKHADLRRWYLDEYLPKGFADGSFITYHGVEKQSGGLKALDYALERMGKDAGGPRLVVDPRE